MTQVSVQWILSLNRLPQNSGQAHMEAHYPNLEFVVLPGTGHFLMLEKPEEFNRLVGDFARKIRY